MITLTINSRYFDILSIHCILLVLSDMDARPWDFQAEEYALRSCVDRFNNRRYVNDGFDPDFKPVDNNLQSILGEELELTMEFKMNYEKWLEKEVHGTQINWELVLRH